MISSQHTQADSDISLDGLAQVKAVTLYTDDKKSLGFNIEKGELVGGAPSVLISNISPGGPAEVSNSLQAGDQILSVDGQKILGYAYDKVKGEDVNHGYCCLYIYAVIHDTRVSQLNATIHVRIERQQYMYIVCVHSSWYMYLVM